MRFDEKQCKASYALVHRVTSLTCTACQREETEKRLSTLGIDRVYFPDFTTSKPTGPHVPILSPPPKVLKTRKRVIVLVNDAIQDLGILAYRQLQRELGINGGSVVNFVKEIIKRSATEHTADQGEKIFADGFQLQDDYRIPALVVLNTGQLLFSHKHNQAMTMRSWSSMPRKSVAHDMIRIHEKENRIKGHHTPKEHVKTVFDEVICDPTRVAPDAEVYVIALEDGTESILHLLEEDCTLKRVARLDTTNITSQSRSTALVSPLWHSFTLHLMAHILEIQT